MNVPSFTFVAFAGTVALLVNASTTPRWRCAVFLIANLAFVTSFMQTPGQLLPFGALLAFGFFGVKLVERYKNRVAFVALLISLIGAFCLLKRYAFIPSAFFVSYAYFTLGMSYVFFRMLHLLIDGYQDTLPHPVGLLSYVNYTLNFTSLVSGPIQLYPDYDRMERQAPPPLDQATIWRAVERLVVGFFKVTVLSPVLAFIQDRSVALAAANPPPAVAIVDVVLVLAVFPVFLYVNFSGYMDCVIGMAAFLRLKLPENFNNPFVSEGFIEFWGRWHMTLSNWVGTYVYSPLLMALMKRVPARDLQPYLGVLAYFVAFFVVGLWHGQTSMFVLLGILFGLGVGVNKFYQIQMIKRLGRPAYRALCRRPLYSSLSRGLTFVWFAFALLWFWSSWTQLGAMIAELRGVAILLGLVLLLGLASAVLAGIKSLESRLTARTPDAASSPITRYARMAWSTVLATVVISVQVALDAPAPHIIYKAF